MTKNRKILCPIRILSRRDLVDGLKNLLYYSATEGGKQNFIFVPKKFQNGRKPSKNGLHNNMHRNFTLEEMILKSNLRQCMIVLKFLELDIVFLA